MDTIGPTHTSLWRGFIQNCQQLIEPVNPLLISGTLTRVAGLVMEAVGLKLAVGTSCIVFLPNGTSVTAEVVGFSGERLFLMPSGDIYGLTPGAKVVPVEYTGTPPASGRHSIRDDVQLTGQSTSVSARNCWDVS